VSLVKTSRWVIAHPQGLTSVLSGPRNLLGKLVARRGRLSLPPPARSPGASAASVLVKMQAPRSKQTSTSMVGAGIGPA
jgi:hypothetical protein